MPFVLQAPSPHGACTALSNMVRSSHMASQDSVNSSVSTTAPAPPVRTPVQLQQTYHEASHNLKTPAVFAMTPSLKATAHRARRVRTPRKEAEKSAMMEQKTSLKNPKHERTTTSTRSSQIPANVLRVSLLRGPPKTRITAGRPAYTKTCKDAPTATNSTKVPHKHQTVCRETHRLTPVDNDPAVESRGAHAGLMDTEISSLKRAFASSHQMIIDTRQQLIEALEKVNETEARLKFQMDALLQRRRASLDEGVSQFQERRDPTKERRLHYMTKRTVAEVSLSASSCTTPRPRKKLCRATGVEQKRSSVRNRSSASEPLTNLFESI